MLSQDVKIGSAVRLDGKIYFCIDFQHVKPGKGIGKAFRYWC